MTLIYRSLAPLILFLPLELQAAPCTTEASTLNAAKAQFEQSCPNLTRRDCDPVNGLWMCSSEQIGHAAPASTIDSTPAVTAPERPVVEDGDVRETWADTLSDAREQFVNQYGVWPRDCDPDGGGWRCSYTVLGHSAPILSSETNPASSDSQSANQLIPTVDMDVVEQGSSSETPGSAATDHELKFISVHFDSSYDPDDLQAMVANRLMIDQLSTAQQEQIIMVNGTKRVQHSGILAGSTDHLRALFPGAYDALEAQSVQLVANEWQTAIESGLPVWVAEGGPSDFTARVISELLNRGVPVSDVHVVQHSVSWNEKYTTEAAMQVLRTHINYITIDDGNHRNRTAQLNTGNDTAFRQRALSSSYGSAWARAFSYLPEKIDFSDSVELMHILGINDISNSSEFADRYF